MNKADFFPFKYRWLLVEGAPKMLVEALKHFGTLEHKDKDNNPSILKWAKEIGGKVANVYTNDEIPWCGLFMAIVAKRSNYEVPKDPLWALNWGTFGASIRSEKASLGDVLVFVRTTPTGAKAGHVALYVGEDKASYHVLGGNQSDAVTITRIPKDRLYCVRRPHFRMGKPRNVRKIYLEQSGAFSLTEQ